jgi:hypothetical protein
MAKTALLEPFRRGLSKTLVDEETSIEEGRGPAVGLYSRLLTRNHLLAVHRHETVCRSVRTGAYSWARRQHALCTRVIPGLFPSGLDPEFGLTPSGGFSVAYEFVLVIVVG